MAKKKAATAEEYFDALDQDRRAALGVVRAAIRKTLPKAVETMQYDMPTYELDQVVCALASQKHYMALYVLDTGVVREHAADLAHLDVGKCCIRFRHLEQLPLPVIKKILKRAAARQKKSGQKAGK